MDVFILCGKKEDQGIRTTVYAVEKSIIEDQKHLLEKSGVDVYVMEANSKAVLRLALRYGDVKTLSKGMKELIAIVDVGHTWSTISFFTKSGSMVFSRSVAYRKMDENLGGKKVELPLKSVDAIINTIQESVIYFSKQGFSVPVVLLSGVEAVDKQLIAECKKAHSDFKLQPIGEFLKIKGLTSNEMHIFGAAIGAALRSVHTIKYYNQHNLLK